jgi:hypothetical protein
MKKSIDLRDLLGPAVRKLDPGHTLTVGLAVPGYNSRIDSWRIRAHGTPTRTTTCIPLGWDAAQKSC